jgi:hypothetical protein
VTSLSFGRKNEQCDNFIALTVRNYSRHFGQYVLSSSGTTTRLAFPSFEFWTSNFATDGPFVVVPLTMTSSLPRINSQFVSQLPGLRDSYHA